MEDFELELKHDFLEESEDLLMEAESAFLRLETERSNGDLLNEIFRLAHNLKGTSKAVGFDQLADLTHEAENLILKLKEGELEVTDTAVSTLLHFKDQVNIMIELLKVDLNATFELDEIKGQIKAVIDGAGVPSNDGVNEENNFEDVEASNEEVIQDFNASDEDLENMMGDDEGVATEESHESETSEADNTDLENNVIDMLGDALGGTDDNEPEINQAALDSLKDFGCDPSVLASLKVEGKLVEDDTSVEAPPAKVEDKAPAKKDVAKTKSNSSEEESIRVKLSRIDEINNVIGELVILQTVISQRRFTYIEDELSNNSITIMGKLFKEVQELAMSLRMLPLKSTFQKMTRIVRDTSKALGKDVTLNIIGDETEVDKTVLEKLADPLVHIVRNAIDHGLETNDERAEAGKEKGVVELFAFHEGSNLVIQITDDGKGIDHEVILQKAIEKNVVPANTSMSPNEIIQLIFHPGFSTKEQVTEVSGRGVGMDVVKTNINALGGEVKVMSKIGEGSSFKIVLPLTLAIIDGVVIHCEDNKYVIPLSHIYEITRMDEGSIEAFTGSAELFKLRGEVIPLFYLNSKLGYKVQRNDKQAIAIIRGLNYPFGVVIDDVVNQQQIVIKKLGEDIRKTSGVMGSAIMGDGKPAFIVDLFELFKSDLKTSRGFRKIKDAAA